MQWKHRSLDSHVITEKISISVGDGGVLPVAWLLGDSFFNDRLNIYDMDVLFLTVGVFLFVAGILFFVYNKRVASGYMGKLQKVTGSETFKSKGVGMYARWRFYLAGVVFILFGLLLIIGSV